jgi:hypothetical protein
MTFIAVCGGRKYANFNAVRSALLAVQRELADEIVAVHGAATGADSLADAAARQLAMQPIAVPALWSVWKDSAGPRRNAVIAKLPIRLLLAFPGNTGTADMVDKAKAAGIEVRECG